MTVHARPVSIEKGVSPYRSVDCLNVSARAGSAFDAILPKPVSGEQQLAIVEQFGRRPRRG
jgi:hypothetical protein